MTRVEVHGGSFLDTPLPTGADVVTLIRVLHDHDDETAFAALRAAHAALPPGGTLLIAEPMAETPGAEAIGDAYFGFYLLAMGSGRARRRAEMTQLLQAAGFTAIRYLASPRPMFASIVTGRKSVIFELTLYYVYIRLTFFEPQRGSRARCAEGR